MWNQRTKVFFSALALALCLGSALQAQEKQAFTLEDVFKKGLFAQRGVYGINWMNDGRYYSQTLGGADADYIVKMDITTGNAVDTLFNGAEVQLNGKPLQFDAYSFSADEKQILLATEEENIYRRSTKAYFYIYDTQSKSLKKLAEGDKQSYATFSPDGSKIAFVRNNDLYYVSLPTLAETRITTDGEWNKIINGNADWVYEEEFYLSQSFQWSPDSKRLAYWRFDESEVPEFNMQYFTDLYPTDYRFKYPKAGEKNSVVDVFVYDLEGKKAQKMDAGPEKDQYLPRIYWINSDMLSLVRLNRLQNQLDILHADVKTGTSKVILTEKAKNYVDINFTDDIKYLSDGKSFIRTSEQDGFKHIYHHKIDGSLIRQITKGAWEAESLLGIDEKKKTLYYISTEDSPIERYLYSISLDGKKKTKMSVGKGVHSVNFSPDFTYYINSFSSNETPLTVSLHTAPSAKQVKVLQENNAVKERLAKYTIGTKEFFTLKASDGQVMEAYTIKPHNFDANKKYPVLMFVYGGPGSQNVRNQWTGGREAWFHYLTQQGYIVACVDNRGTGAKGRDFRQMTYGMLGKYEVEDQIAGAKYLGGLPFVDKDRIGIFGWSYGGYMSSLSLFIGNDVFKTAIAVAPVTNWRYYDTIYTERYCGLPQENGEGYDAYSPLSHVDKLKGNLLLIHGTGDDNVHFQNAVMMQEALIQANKQFESFYYPNKNHGIYGGNTTFHLYTQMTDFLLRKL
ncbi:S9 family peptidase [Cytophagales bacterium LB-30]|uniref:S9 family peptidase n=1 Tax=Shiella aurantiaca TaxID=3058365 RepID=A0ABT8F567_9BACT|nr:S9 family peptidase [Shiella aurantiaca]MDN4165607.1 S9 family peptidase [Shiella aurantiaca]